MKVFSAVPQNPCAISVAVFAYPMKAGGAALSDFDKIRWDTG